MIQERILVRFLGVFPLSDRLLVHTSAERRQKNGPVQCHLVIEKTVENDHPLPPYPLDHFTSQKRGQRDLKFRLMQKALSHGLCE
jgi:hypothetical protein